MSSANHGSWLIRAAVAGGACVVVLSGPAASADRIAAPSSAAQSTGARPALIATVASPPSLAPRVTAPPAPTVTGPAPTTVAPATTAPPTTAPTTTAPTTTVDPQLALRAEYLAAINAARAVGRTCGTTFMPAAPPLAWDDRVGAAALAHSQDQSDMNLMTHTGSDGSDAGTRLTRAGYSWHGWGENVAWGYTSTAQVMTGWLGSTGHCSNLMNASWTVVGMGRVNNFWTQDFARP